VKKANFNIIGAGSIGHLWHCFLSNKGFESNLYTRTARASQTISVESSLGHFTQQVNYQTIDSLSPNTWQPANITLVCVKAHQLKNLCESLKQNAINPSNVILMMNGLGLIEIVKTLFPATHVIQANITHGVYLKGNQLVHAGVGKIGLGNFNSKYNKSDWINTAALLNQVLPKVTWDENHQQNLYLKLIINAIINPITAINNQTNGFLLQASSSKTEQSTGTENRLIPIAQSLLNEMRPLLEKIIPEMSFETIEKSIIQVAMNTRNNHSSMLQDIQAKRPTEIDFINGYLCQLAQKHRLTLPTNNEIISKIKNLAH
jgi:2-dehydropantoate 2-reductase